MSINPFDESGSFFVSVNGAEQRGLRPASADVSRGWWADCCEAGGTPFRDFIDDDRPDIRAKDLLERLEGAGLSLRKP